jgi:hypothetical protein
MRSLLVADTGDIGGFSRQSRLRLDERGAIVESSVVADGFVITIRVSIEMELITAKTSNRFMNSGMQLRRIAYWPMVTHKSNSGDSTSTLS